MKLKPDKILKDSNLNDSSLNDSNFNNSHFRLNMKLDIVEQTTVKLLQDGYTIPEVSRLLGLNLSPVVAELIYKGVLYPDTTFRKIRPLF